MEIFYIIMFAIFITLIVIEFRYKLRFDKVNGELVVWYNVSRYSTERDYIFLSDIF